MKARMEEKDRDFLYLWKFKTLRENNFSFS